MYKEPSYGINLHPPFMPAFYYNFHFFTFLIIDFFRKGNRMPTFQNTDEFDIFSVLSDNALSAEGKIIKNQIHEDVKKLVDELPDDQREALMMRIFKDMSFKEISEQTNVSINTALGRMRYALINLRKMIDNNNIILTN